MKAFVVYESLWGNTAAIARAIAEGIGPDAEALTTDAARPERIADADLIVAGAPVLGFALPTDQMRDTVARSEAGAPSPPDLSHPSMRSWLESLPQGHGGRPRSRPAYGGHRAGRLATSSAVCSGLATHAPPRLRSSSSPTSTAPFAKGS